MKIAGIICEYNPFHAGHAFHIAQTRKLTGCDYVVACMAGSFVQRGEAACLSKWARAEMALRCGADAVFELPTLYALRTADVFAMGGVAILDGIGADILSFGSECTDFHLLQTMAALRENEPECISRAIQCGLAEGKSHARARGEAIAEYLNIAPEAVNQPNWILACEYLHAISVLNAQIQPVMIRRTNDYHAKTVDERFASATAIRQMLRENDIEQAQKYIPEAAHPLLKEWKGMHHPNDLLLYKLRSMTAEEIAALADASEGIENRVKRSAGEAFDYESLLESLKCKRYTRARLSRLCAHAMLNLTKALADRHPVPEYARLIGMRSDARDLMHTLKHRTKIPIVANASEIADSEVFSLECRATDLRALCMNDSAQRLQGAERTAKFVIV